MARWLSAASGVASVVAALIEGWYVRLLGRDDTEARIRYAEREGMRRLAKIRTLTRENYVALEHLRSGVLNEIGHAPSEDEKQRIVRNYEAFFLTKRATLWRETCWFQKMMLFVPREVRSPALDHILEDRKDAAAKGCPRWIIEASTVSKCLGLILFVAWGFLWDVLNPFKSRSRISGGD